MNHFRTFASSSKIKSLLVILMIIQMVFITGCWSNTDYNGRSFVKALGIDYVDGKFHSYAQFLSFTNIAKSESGGSTASKPVTWVGKGVDTSFFKATTNLYKTTQTYVLWGHVTAFVLSERALKAHGGKLMEMINRHPESRYNTWIYVTKDPIDDVLSTNSFFEMSALFSILHNPEPNYRQYSYLPPITTVEYLSHYTEPAATSYLPSITVNRDTWQQSQKKLPLLKLNGAYFQANEHYKGFLTETQMQGYHWMLDSTQRAPLSVKDDNELIAQLSLSKPKVKIKTIINDDDITFHISIKLKGELYEYLEPVSYEKLVTLAAEQVKKEVLYTYSAAFKKGIDIYDLGLELRHRQPDLWRKLSNNNTKLIIDQTSIEKIDVKVNIPYFGKYKRRTT
ncbi:Ger(x)C family spore germination protein [Paenibacillus yanchengensis]|uniref:Ger(X)C family spore germination protein n=1 Tax=Paenibacillus yanchengensis TaxID=2035833 RepID=A0ABW4YF97_9BACL